jgi:hypothetical protein
MKKKLIYAGRGEGMARCVLCRYAGGCNTTVNEVMAYIRENVSIVDIDELAEQACSMLVQRVDATCTKDMVRTHITTHSQDHRIVTSMLLRELRPLVQTLRSTCLSHDEEGNAVVNVKHMNLYLKTVEVAAVLSSKVDMHVK